MADRRGRPARARLHAQDGGGRGVHARAAARAHDGPRLLPVRVLAGLHGPALASTTSCSEDFARPGRDALRRVVRRDVLADRVQGSSSGSRSSSSRTSSPRARPAARSASTTRAASRSARSWSIDPDGTVRWSYQADLARRSARREPDLRRALRPERPRLRPAAAGRARRPCARGAAGWWSSTATTSARSARRSTARCASWTCGSCFRHFPVRSSHPRAWRRRLCRRGGRPAGRVLGDARRAVRRPGPARGPAPVGARGDARARRGALRRRPPLGRRAGARQGAVPRRACAPAWSTTPTRSSTASCTRPGRLDACPRGTPSLGRRTCPIAGRAGRLTRSLRRYEPEPDRRVCPRGRCPPTTPNCSPASRRTPPARPCVRSIAPTRASSTASR